MMIYQLIIKTVADFYQKYKNSKILIFGFTYLLYKNFLKQLSPKSKCTFHKESIVIHGGGWKRKCMRNL